MVDIWLALTWVASLVLAYKMGRGFGWTAGISAACGVVKVVRSRNPERRGFLEERISEYPPQARAWLQTLVSLIDGDPGPRAYRP